MMVIGYQNKILFSYNNRSPLQKTDKVCNGVMKFEDYWSFAPSKNENN